jgi:hypothetical protein
MLLRWTCRLRDVLERRGLLVASLEKARIVSEIREAEFVALDGAFPTEFRWETLQSSSDPGRRGWLSLYPSDGYPVADYRDVDFHSPISISIRSFSGQSIEDLQQHNIDILWLSKSVFVSRFCFTLEIEGAYRSFRRLSDYQLSFSCDAGMERHWFFATTLSSIQGDDRWEPSPLPIELFRHLTALLPPNYFDKISLWRWFPQCCPADYLIRFLSIIPPHSRTATTTTVRLVLHGHRTVTSDELQLLFSHHFHHLVKLAFDRTPFDESVTETVFNNLLKDAKYLRAVELPHALVWKDSASDCPLYLVRTELKSPDLWMQLPYNARSSNWLYAFSKHYDSKDMDVRVCHQNLTFTATQRRKLLVPFLDPFMDTNSLLENLCLRLTYQFSYVVDDDTKRANSLRRVSLMVASEMTTCNSKNLCVFNAYIVYFSEDRLIDWRCNRIELWDKDIFPLLVLNFHRKRLTNPGGPVIQLALRAVNQGVVYSKTTDHLPCDGSIANAGLIFRIVKGHAQGQSGFGHSRRHKRKWHFDSQRISVMKPEDQFV